MKKIKTMESSDIARYSKKYDIPLENSYELDTTFTTFLFSLDTIRYKQQQKNHYQPLQALYYDSTGELQSFQINCFAGGFPNLKWERNGIFTTFPPKEQAPIDSILSLEKYLEFVKPISEHQSLPSDSLSNYTIIVHWGRFMHRQSKRLIRLVKENAALAPNDNVRIIYLNNDNIFFKSGSEY